MTTLNEHEQARFLRTLQDDLQFRNQVRSLLLHQELLELPERFAQFATFVTEFIERQEAINQSVQEFITEQREVNARHEAFIERQEAINQSVQEFIAKQETFNVKQEAFNAKQEAFNVKQEAFNAKQEAFNAKQEAVNQRVMDSLGILRGSATRRLLVDSWETILDRFGLEFASFHYQNDLARMSRQSGFSQTVAVGQRQSFFRADLTLEGVDVAGNTWFIAGEASFTADRRDSDRAIRNAHFLTQITGHQARPLVASVSNDYFVQSLVDCGAIHWLQLDPRQIEAD